MARHEHMLDSESKDTRLRCPKDSTLMEKSTVRGEADGKPAEVTVDRCAVCGAVWLDKHELETLLSMKAARQVDIGPFHTNRQNPRASEAVGGLTCPRDASYLVEVEHEQQRHVLICICTECGGKLLDAGELLDLAEFTVVERIKSALRGA